MEKLTFDGLPEAVALLLEKVSRIEMLLSGQQSEQTPFKDMLTAKEAAAYMGVSMSTLYKMTHRKEVPAYKPTGGMLYFKRSEIVEHLSKNRVSSMEEIEKAANDYITRNPLKLR